MTHQTKAELIGHYRKQYRRAGKKEKTDILNIVVETTGYARKHAIALLNSPSIPAKVVKRPRMAPYAHIYDSLKRVWAAANCICGKRLKPFLPAFLDSLKRHGEIEIAADDEALLLNASASTIDRLLAPARKEIKIKGRGTTKPGTVLKHQIPIRTFADWNEDMPGFLEIDLVAHCGGSARGEYINTLTMTDVATGWTICAAFMGRSEAFCVAAIRQATPSFPFPILGIDSDNGGEFINAHLKRYCERNSITFTRGRANKKNDSCYVEQKNWDVVRKMIGHARLDTYEQLDILKRIHNLLALYQNYFQPSQKLLSKQRNGASVRKTYDTAQTPAQRLLACVDAPQELNNRLRDIFHELNPAELLRSINHLAIELSNL